MKRRVKDFLSVVMVLSLLASLGFSARPFSVEDSGVLDKGFELELGYAGDTDGAVRAYEKSFVINAALIPEKIQIGYERSYSEIQNHPFGSADSAVTVKYNFLPNQAFKGSISMIDGDEKNGFGNEYTEYSLVYAHDLAFEKLNIYSSVGYTAYNAGDWYEYTKDDEGNEVNPLVKNNCLLGLGFQYPLLANLDLCLEATKQVVQGDYLDNLDGYVSGMLGLVWTIYDIPFDLSYTTQADSNEYTYAVGLTLAF